MPTASGYLVQYGRSSFVGRFEALNGLSVARGDRVVIESPRGLELGTVLCETNFAASLDPATGGTLLRVVDDNDERDQQLSEQLGQHILAAGEQLAIDQHLPLLFVDIEVMLDRGSAVLHTVPWELCDATPLFVQISQQFDLPVRLLDLSRTPTVTDPPEKSAKCSKPGCGTSAGGCSSCGTGGGCSTGSCSKGSVKSASELTAYFANLRQQMEAQASPQANQRTPLN